LLEMPKGKPMNVAKRIAVLVAALVLLAVPHPGAAQKRPPECDPECPNDKGSAASRLECKGNADCKPGSKCEFGSCMSTTLNFHGGVDKANEQGEKMPLPPNAKEQGEETPLPPPPTRPKPGAQ
jgi:hypothetical protein